MSYIQMLWHNTAFNDIIAEFFSKPALPDLMDRYVGLAQYLHENFGTVGTLRVGKVTTELLVWVPNSTHVIVFSPNAPDAQSDAYQWRRNGSVTLRGANDDELEGYSKGAPIRAEHEGYMLWINSIGVHQEHSEGSFEDLLSMRKRI